MREYILPLLIHLTMAKYIKLNPKASIFYDQASKIKVLRKDVVEITENQFNSRVIRAAIANGYLIEVKAEEVKVKTEEVNPKKKADSKKEVDTEALKDKFIGLIEAGEAPEKIKDQFNGEELKALAISLDIEPEDGDTKLDLVNAILDEFNSGEDE
jgi:hypothetical protein